MFKTNLAILKLCAEKILDGDYLDLVEMGFTTEDINALANFNLVDIQKTAKDLDANIFNLKIVDPKLLSQSIAKTKTSQERKKAAIELIKLGASSEMMRQVTGMNNKIFSATKQALGLPQDNGGRPRAVTEKEARTAWLYFKENNFIHPQTITLQQWVDFCTATKISADVVYRAICTWYTEEKESGL